MRRRQPQPCDIFMLTREDGQAIIQVTLSLVVLIAFVALAIDVGNTYGQRRQMQNAADASALAGARELCLGSSEDTARAAARAYLINNGVEAGAIGAGDILITDNKVDVRARVNVTPLVGQIVSWGAVDVEATAQAACGAATSACGLWPVAFKNSSWQKLYDPEGEEECRPTKVAIWTDKNANQEPLCTIGGVPQDNLCGCYDCDLDDDEEDDFALLATVGRAWLDFSAAVLPYTDTCVQNGCGANEVGRQIRNGQGTKITVPTCISGDRGVKAGVQNDVKARSGQNVAIALYETTGCGTTNCNNNGDTFWVTTFGCIKVAAEPWEKTFVIDKIGGGPQDTLRGKVIWAYVDCANSCMTNCGGTDGTPAELWQLRAVSILK